MNRNINTFEDQEYLYKIRQDILNPLITKVENVVTPRLVDVEGKVKDSFKDAKLDASTKTLTFKDHDNMTFPVDLTPIIPEFNGIGVQGQAGQGPVVGIDIVQMKDATITTPSTGVALVKYDWDNLVKANQRNLVVKVGQLPTDIHSVTSINFKGATDNVQVVGDTLNFEIPSPTPLLKAQIDTGAKQDIDSIKVTGNVASSEIDGTTLTINLPTSGGGGTITNQNFKGFFTTLGDIESEVTDPINGKSYAFALDSKYGNQYYTPYYYINNGWTELKQDPALLYTPETSQGVQGVFSIKSDPKITIDKNGQIDLSKLGEDSPGHFHGFYENLTDLQRAVPTPTPDRDFAYVKHTNGAWLGRQYKRNTSGELVWAITAPLGAISLIEGSGGGSSTPAPLYGFYQNGMITIDSNGLGRIKDTTAPTTFEVTDSKGDTTTSTINSVVFPKGASFVELDPSNKKATITHPQRVVSYDSQFETNHGEDFTGNIFYDEVDQAWIGRDTRQKGSPTEKQWTRIIHRGMSEEVTELATRLGKKAKDVVAGILGDDPLWQANSWTHVDKDDSQLPEEIREVCGGYFTTIIQDVQGEDPNVKPTERIQMCTADDTSGKSFVRTWNKGTSEGSADYGWRPWVKVSWNSEIMKEHNDDPGAHRNISKYYKVSTIDELYSSVRGSNGWIFDKNLMLIADSHGLTLKDDLYSAIPYTGKFKISCAFAFDRMGTGNTPLGKWTAEIYRKKPTDTEYVVAKYEFTVTNDKKRFPPMSFSTDPLDFNKEDKIWFKIYYNNESGITSWAPDMKFIPYRSYIVIEDFETDSGYLVAETNRKLHGPVNVTGSVGINVHYANYGDSGTIRTYGTAVETTYKTMNKT